MIDNEDAVARLGKLCDGILWHDRTIARGVDDSVFIDMGAAAPIPIRRARGYVPAPIALPTRTGAGICLGGELKSVAAVVRGDSAILSQHLGDLSHPRTYHLLGQTITDLRDLFCVQPQWIAHDLHPGYLSTMHARKLATELRLPTVGVQHHHAHAAALMAESKIAGPILAIVCDGTGYGTDGTTWGGELLVADLVGFKRFARLKPIRLAGGDAAATDIRRCGLALLYQTLGNGFESHPAATAIVADKTERSMLCQMIAKDVRCAVCTSAGRLFDGVASLLGICQTNRFEAEAAMALQALAATSKAPAISKPLFELHSGHLIDIDFVQLIRYVLEHNHRGVHAGELAALFHEQFALAWAEVVKAAVEKTGLLCVGLTGGTFCNPILTARLTELLEEEGLHVLRHRIVPPNDGGIALGQAAVASARALKGLMRKAGA